jgi:hypothetical protein
MRRHDTTRRFRARARIITIAAPIATGIVAVGGAVAIASLDGPRDGVLVAYLAIVFVMGLLVAVFGVITARHSRTLNALTARYPADAVFLARRLPPVVSDLPAFLRSKGVDAQIGDGWYAGVAHPGGISVFSSGSDPRELVRMDWDEVGDVAMVRTPTVGGDSRWSVTIDVKPYVVPLTVDLGDAWGIVTMNLDAADTAAVLRLLESRRPTSTRA